MGARGACPDSPLSPLESSVEFKILSKSRRAVENREAAKPRWQAPRGNRDLGTSRNVSGSWQHHESSELTQPVNLRFWARDVAGGALLT